MATTEPEEGRAALTRTGTFAEVNSQGSLHEFLDSLATALLHHKIRVPRPPSTEIEVALTESSVDDNSQTLYAYDSLDTSSNHVRILTLLSSDSEQSEMRCLLRHANLDESPKYACLSYVWGNPTIQIPILVNGKRFTVTENLFLALRKFRRLLCADSPIELWIDAVCINQSDITERNAQLHLMTTIYQKAYVVMLWMGEEADQSDLAIDLINAFGSQVIDTKEFQTWKKFPQSMAPDSWNALYALFNRPFWRRMWILQEFVLARVFIMICGNKLTRSFLLELAYFSWIDNFNSKQQILSIGLGEETAEAILRTGSQIDTHMKCRFVHSDHEKASGPLPILDVVTLTWVFETTDPRDRVFGLLGITINSIAPDYSKSVRDIYSGFARNQLEEGRFDILFLAGTGMRPKNGSYISLPSWVPDLKSFVDTGSQLWFDRRDQFTAGDY